MIELRAVTKAFPAKVAVDQASFTLAQPCMLGIIGRSGAGKSTLLRIINRLTPATAGEVLVDGRDVLALRGAAQRAWQHDCAMIFQQFNLVPRLDVLTNVMIGGLNRRATLTSVAKMFSRNERLQALHALDRLGLADTAQQRAEHLSGGQQQRVAIARALVQNPRMLLADEPIASLDPLNAKVVMQALRNIHEQQSITVICNLHTLDTARAYCDRIIGMRDGRIVFDGTPAELDTAMARDIYGAGKEFDEATTSTDLARPINGFRPAAEGSLGSSAAVATAAAA